MNSNLKVLFLAAEAEPLIKVGGLGDVAGSLPQGLCSYKDVDIRLVIPYHKGINLQSHPFTQIEEFDIPNIDGPIRTQIYSSSINGLPIYLVASPLISDDDAVYHSDASLDGPKFTLFSLSALELVQHINWSPDIVHANDWHSAIAIYALKINNSPFFKNTTTVLGLHNLPYLGVGAGAALKSFGLPPARDSSLPWWAQDMPLALGLLAADQIVAASPTYAQEILTPEYGSGLEDYLQSRATNLSGILNGINTDLWNPATDPFLAANYSTKNPLERVNKEALRTELGLENEQDIPLLAMVGRMDPQKGVDLIPDALNQIADLPWQIVLLGTGFSNIEASILNLQSLYPQRIRVILRYDPVLSHKIYAGADAILIPSIYEPCGLTQMIAMRYGCVPIACATGGLRDTIIDYDASKDSTGFLFFQKNSDSLANAIRRAIKIYTQNQEWTELMHRGMLQDFSWNCSAQKYLDLYYSLKYRIARNSNY